MALTTVRKPVLHNNVTGLKETTHAFTRGIPDSFADGLTTRGGNPDIGLAREQKAERIAAIEAAGVKVTVLPNYGNPDETYVRDTALEHAGVLFMANPAKPSRRKEIAPALNDFKSLFRDVVPWQGTHEATVEFGDVVYIGKNTYVIGQSERTNRAGAYYLMSAMRDVDPTLKFVLSNVSGVLHFETGATPVTNGILLRDPHMPVDALIHNYIEVVTVPNRNGYAASVLTVNDTVLVAREHKEVEEIVVGLSIPDLKVVPVSTSETARMDGSLPCDFTFANSKYGGLKANVL